MPWAGFFLSLTAITKMVPSEIPIWLHGGQIYNNVSGPRPSETFGAGGAAEQFRQGRRASSAQILKSLTYFRSFCLYRSCAQSVQKMGVRGESGAPWIRICLPWIKKIGQDCANSPRDSSQTRPLKVACPASKTFAQQTRAKRRPKRKFDQPGCV